MIRNLLILIIALGIGSCLEPPDFADVPSISFIGMSKDSLMQGVFEEDSLRLRFSFEDGDGDIGRENNTPENNVFLLDTRTGQLDNSFGIPFIPQQGSSNGIEGTVELVIYSTCCIFPNGQDPCQTDPNFPYDTLQYEIYIVDRAGNESNRITTSAIRLICN